jgi:hypothetical protein
VKVAIADRRFKRRNSGGSVFDLEMESNWGTLGKRRIIGEVERRGTDGN